MPLHAETPAALSLLLAGPNHTDRHLQPLSQRATTLLPLASCSHRIKCRRNSLELTQEYMARMLCVRRASIGEAASSLQHSGMIRYTRGRITVLDRPRLELSSCECYQISKAVFDKTLNLQIKAKTRANAAD